MSQRPASERRPRPINKDSGGIVRVESWAARRLPCGPFLSGLLEAQVQWERFPHASPQSRTGRLRQPLSRVSCEKINVSQFLLRKAANGRARLLPSRTRTRKPRLSGSFALPFRANEEKGQVFRLSRGFEFPMEGLYSGRGDSLVRRLPRTLRGLRRDFPAPLRGASGSGGLPGAALRLPQANRFSRVAGGRKGRFFACLEVLNSHGGACTLVY